jgi:TolA-binding protein
LQAGSALLWRGKPRTAQEKYASELTAALAFYRDDKYAEAAQQFARIVKTYPRGVEAQLYLGISQLYLQQNTEAVPALVAAQELGPEQFRDDATWYLALAYQRAGDTAAVLRELQKLCSDKSNYRGQACEGMKQLSGK